MKVEYSYFGDNPSLTIKSADFTKALKDGEERYLLQVAVDGFCANFGAVSHFDDRVNEAVVEWLDKTGTVIYALKERFLGSRVVDSWCEVYVQNGIRLIEVVFYDNNRREFILRDKQTEGYDE
jgi:hypothetical protein